MKKILSGLFLGFGVILVIAKANAASIAVSPKQTYVLNYTTTVSTVTPVVSTNAIATSAFQPGAVYEIIQSSGATSEYVALYDTATVTGVTCGSLAGNPLTARILFSSTTANTITKFDPPLQFTNGLVACDSAITGQTSITYELGRGLQGN